MLTDVLYNFLSQQQYTHRNFDSCALWHGVPNFTIGKLLVDEQKIGRSCNKRRERASESRVRRRLIRFGRSVISIGLAEGGSRGVDHSLRYTDHDSSKGVAPTKNCLRASRDFFASYASHTRPRPHAVLARRILTTWSSVALTEPLCYQLFVM